MSGQVSFGLCGDNSSLGGEPFYRTMAKKWPAPEFGLFVSKINLDGTANPSQSLENGGELSLGGLNSALYNGTVKYIPTKGNRWALQLNDILLDGISIMSNSTVAAGGPGANSSAGGAAGAPGAGSAAPLASSTMPVQQSAAPGASSPGPAAAPVGSSQAPQAPQGSPPVASAPAPPANSPSIQARQDAAPPPPSNPAPAPPSNSAAAPPAGSAPAPASPSAPAPASPSAPAPASPSAPAPASPSAPASPAAGGNATTNSTGGAGGAAGGVPSPTSGLGTAALWLNGGSLISEDLAAKLLAAIPGSNRTEATAMNNMTTVTYNVPCTTNSTLTIDVGGHLFSLPASAWIYRFPGGARCAAFFAPLNQTSYDELGYDNDTQVVLGLNVLQTVYTAFRFGSANSTDPLASNSTGLNGGVNGTSTGANATAPANPLVNPNATGNSTGGSGIPMIGFAALSDAAKGVIPAPRGNSTSSTIPGVSTIPVVTATGAGVSASAPNPVPSASGALKLASSVGGVLVTAALAFVAL